MTEAKGQSIVGAVIAIVNVLVLLGVLDLSEDQIAGITTGLVAVMGAIRAFFAPEVKFIGPSTK